MEKIIVAGKELELSLMKKEELKSVPIDTKLRFQFYRSKFNDYEFCLLEAKKDENLIAINERLKKIAVIDDLTGIGNMHQFSPDALDVLSRKDNQIYLFLNIENFKNYNDQFGYQAGNEYLTYINE